MGILPKRGPVVWLAATVALSTGGALVGACIDSGGTGPYVFPTGDAAAGHDAGKPDAAAATDAAAIGDANADDGALPAVDAGVDAGPCPIGPTDTVPAWLHVTADNRRTVWVNGVVVDQTENEWNVPSNLPITLYRSPLRKNVIAIEGRNLSSQDGLDRGILADIEIGTVDAEGADAGADAGPFPVAAAHLVSDGAWKIAKTVPATPDWTAVDFDDSAFVAATTQGKNGVAPWGQLLTFSTSSDWIWTFVSSGTTAEKVDVESAYARRTFYFDVTGKVSETKVACP